VAGAGAKESHKEGATQKAPGFGHSQPGLRPLPSLSCVARSLSTVAKSLRAGPGEASGVDEGVNLLFCPVLSCPVVPLVASTTPKAWLKPSLFCPLSHPRLVRVPVYLSARSFRPPCCTSVLSIFFRLSLKL
jgi:hypothetical protein